MSDFKDRIVLTEYKIAVFTLEKDFSHDYWVGDNYIAMPVGGLTYDDRAYLDDYEGSYIEVSYVHDTELTPQEIAAKAGATAYAYFEEYNFLSIDFWYILFLFFNDEQAQFGWQLYRTPGAYYDL